MYGGNLSLNIPEQILNFVVSSENFKFVQQLTDDDYQTWLAYQKSNGKPCIAKKFLMSKPSNVDLHKYYQEVVTLSQIDNFFVSSLIGFTNKYPYCIFMEYRKNSTLYRALHIEKTSYPLTGAHLTNIAMGIAYGMIKIQQMKMTEPYLSSSNIYLTPELLPKICHFNTIPDPIKWKAPELYHSITRAKYNTGLDESDSSDSQNDFYKADVFAYGLILHELLTRRDYFVSMSPERVKKIVYDDNKRPSIPKNTPQILQKLIRDCWSQNPKKRPSFGQIFEYFESGEVSFPETNSDTVDALSKRIKNHEMNLANSIKMENYKQEIAYSSHNQSPISTRSLSPNARKNSPFSYRDDQQAKTPNRYGHNHHHRHHHRSVSRNDFNFFNNDIPQTQNFFLSDAPTKRRGNSVSRDRNRYINTSINHNNHSLTDDNEIYFSTNHSSDNSFTNANTNTSLTSQSTTHNNHRNSKVKNEDSPKIQKKNIKSTKSNPTNLANLQVFEDCYKPKFFSSLQSLPQKIDPSQYGQFFKIIAKYFSCDCPPKVVQAICDTIQILFRDDLAIKEFINQDLYKFLPFDDQQLIESTFEILYILFDYSPQTFQANFTQQMSLLIRKKPEKALTLISMFAKSFSNMKDPWSLLDLLFQHSEIFFRSCVGSEYVSCLFFLNFNFSRFSEEKKSQTRPILVHFLASSDKHAVSMTYRAIINLFDDFFKIPLDIMMKDLADPDMCLLAVSVMLRMKDSDLIPISSSKRPNFNFNKIVRPLIKAAESHEEATILLLRYLKNREVAKIVLENSICLTRNLPTIQDTLKIFISLMTHSSLRDSIAEIEVLPEFFTNVIKSDKIPCMLTLPSLVTRLNLKKKIFRNLIEHQFFSLLLNSFGSYNDDHVTISNLNVLIYFANIGESTEYLKFSDCLRTLIWSENPEISSASFKCLYRMSFYQQCASRYKQMKLDEDVLQKFDSESSNKKVQHFLQNLERAEISD